LRKISREIELRAGRSANGKREPRSIDVDILLVGDAALDEPDLTVPHPRMWERRFVVQPLADLAPELVVPGWEANVRGSVRRLTENARSAEEFAGLTAAMSSSSS
jgi:2-amino-4-hydroxy-6-hydroxymethyldihydropteridine diphosphokinase